MTKKTQKFEIKIDPLDFHVGLKDKMAEFESLIRMENPGKKLAEKVKEKLNSRFCHCCFFGRVEGLLKYQGDKAYIYAWLVSEHLKFDTPKTLEEFNLNRPPQSWCYTERDI